MSDSPQSQDFDATLRALVLKTRGGDQMAYKKLLTELAPLIRRMIAKRIGMWGQQAFIEDIAQETLLAVHLKLHTYDIQLPFLAWLSTVARHKLIDHLRRTKTGHISLEDDDMPELIDPVNPEAAMVARDLDKLLKQLKPPAGDIIYALKVEGMSVRELSTRYRLSENNIKVIVHRGLQKLAHVMMADHQREAQS